VRRSSWLLIASAVALAAVLFLFVFPTSSWLAQRRDRHQVEAELRLLTAQNQSLERRVHQLRTPAEIERIARAKYNLVRPGEEAFAILPPRAAPATAPAGRAHEQATGGRPGGGLWERVWARARALF
jgi:cell division protein FtsB